MRYREITEAPVEGYDLKAKYDEFNRKWFEGQLPDIPMSWENKKGRGGAVLWRKSTRYPYPVLRDSLHLVMSRRFKRSEEAFDKILLHEMIHVYFLSRGIDESHGPRFSAMRRRLSELTGIDIPIKDDVEDVELVDSRVKTFGVFVVHRKVGPPYFALLFPKAAHVEGQKEAWEKHLEKFPKYIYAAMYTVSTPKWTLKAAITPLQRSLNGKSINFYLLDDDLYDDLKANGHLVWEVSKQ